MAITELHGPAVGYPLGGRVDALVARWAGIAPESPALRWGDRVVSYAELVGGARAVAAALAASGLCPAQRVAVRLPPGPDLVQVLLGILMCGGVYAGAAMDWPRDRYRQVVEQTGAVLAIEETSGLFAPAGGSGRYPGNGGPADPCCVFFTSGSSGRPRAVLSPHSGTSRIALDPYLGFDRRTTMYQISPLGWDAMSLELWGPLINGGTSVLHRGGPPTPGDLRAAVAAGVDTLFLTSSLFNAVVDEDVGALSGLRYLMTGGERISAHHVSTFRAAHPRMRLSHVYGPVESCIYATGYDIPAGPAVADDYPIGRPLANTGAYLVDGQLALSGDGLALAYLGDPEATADRFRVRALGPGGAPVRVYLTGDVVDLDDAGQLCFRGRRDRQFKLRGVRIEPEEVEAAMARVPGVARGVLLPLPLSGQVKSESVGFVTGTAQPATVREQLAALLPAAFVPNRVLLVPRLPANANGKLDTALLERWAGEQRQVDRKLVSHVEDGSVASEVDAVVRAAAELLGVPVGPDDDLFELGADSLTAIRLATRLELKAAAVLRGRTPRAIAGAAGVATGRRRQGRDWRWVGELPISQYRMWYLEQQHPGTPDTIRQLLFHIAGPLDVPALSSAVDAVVRRHEALRTLLRAPDGRHVEPCVVTVDGVLEVEPAEDIDEFLHRPFDLAHHIPLRAGLFQTGVQEYRLALAVHHTAFDGWSEGVLCRDLSAAYRGIALPGAPGFSAVARLQSRRAGDDDAFWLDHLRGVPEIALGSTPAAGSGPLASVPVELSEVDTTAVHRMCAARRVTPGAVYLAAWVQALRAETGSLDFAVGMPLAGRTVAAAEEVVGCFASSAVLRFPRSIVDTDDCLRHSGELLERLLGDPYVPLERAYFDLRPPQTGRNPFCQVGFVLQNNQHDDLSLAGLTVHAIQVRPRRSVFELALELWKQTPQDSQIWYRTDVVDPARAARLAEGWLTVVAELTHPRRRPAARRPGAAAGLAGGAAGRVGRPGAGAQHPVHLGLDR
ncbi:MAG: AMP-binding protein [Micromonosporaceae bacterium]|nr:AMP-binding protein [Micromonosporaceae bacterium]